MAMVRVCVHGVKKKRSTSANGGMMERSSNDGLTKMKLAFFFIILRYILTRLTDFNWLGSVVWVHSRGMVMCWSVTIQLNEEIATLTVWVLLFPIAACAYDSLILVRSEGSDPKTVAWEWSAPSWTNPSFFLSLFVKMDGPLTYNLSGPMMLCIHITQHPAHHHRILPKCKTETGALSISIWTWLFIDL